jgi:radical SAM superfamily enzyme YgiQ (UPF0313 family)
MARVLLINSNRFRHPWPVIPFGLCYVAAALETNGSHNVRFLDLCFSGNCEKDIKNAIRNFVPEVIGISIRNIDDTGGYNTHFLLEDVKNEVIDFCKNEFPGPIVIGGPSVGISGREMLEYFDLEYAVRGDGEAIMPEFVNRIEMQHSPEGLKGLIIRRNGLIIQDNEPDRIPDLDLLPFPKPSRYLDLNRYRRVGSPLHIQTKRGCSFRCSYCTYNRIEGKHYRLRNPILIADEIEALIIETGINHIEFTDSIFNFPLSHAKEVLREIIGRKLDLRLHTMGLSPAGIDEELLDLMVSAGFNEADIGAESACDTILTNLAKNFRKADVINASILIKKKKIPVTWFVMLGAFAETRETVIETLNTIGRISSKFDLVFISTGLRVYNGSPVAEDLIRNGALCPDDNFLRPVKIEPEKISLEEIHSIAKSFSFRFPNFYFYEKNHIIPDRVLILGNTLLKIFHSRQPVWRLLILLKMTEKALGISLLKRGIYKLKTRMSHRKKRTDRGFALIRYR